MGASVSGGGSITIYQAIISGPQDITAGPDGALWFTNYANDSIGRITTTGQVTNYTGLPGGGAPFGITAGPDGALWFTTYYGDQVGRITTTGQVTAYTAIGISRPQGITAGPDGALWFTNSTGNSIGRITPVGQPTTYTATGLSGPAGVVAGPDGALWFTNSTDNSIGRITTPRPHKVISNPRFAGYQTAVAAGYATSSAASFIVPKLSCTAALRAFGPAAGVEANNRKTFSSAFLFTGCVNGKAVYYPALVINGNETDYPASHLSAGDVINLSTNVTTSGTVVQVTDATTGITKKRTGAGASADAAYIGDSAWFSSIGTRLGVPKFGTLTFTHCLIDGGTLAVSLPHQYQRVNHAGAVQIATGTLSPSGTKFATHYRHS